MTQPEEDVFHHPEGCPMFEDDPGVTGGRIATCTKECNKLGPCAGTGLSDAEARRDLDRCLGGWADAKTGRS